MTESARPRTTLVIMNKNDLAGAREVIPRIDRSLFCEMFVMDGGSTDGSLEFFEEQQLDVNVLYSGGRGGAFRFAMDRARGDYIVFLSTDGEEDPTDLPQFLRRLDQGADLVIASRLAKGAHHKAQERLRWMHRLLYLKFITFLVNKAFGAKLTDCWNGYRGFKLSALKEVKTDAEDFLIEPQQTMRFLKAGKTVAEFPTHEGHRVGGKSGNPIFKSGWLITMMLFREWRH